ncbi:hypothetical protein HPB47_022820 [Ixodes persulcatus]|uniref:Uncharacterized protein n=1 Tax=Ixodes persulcatus TaxID=34615 RepID=A0AC60Q8L8_IXOPE|nr:hypothetical protein HPB47_022820 [Ixodes persulcatus]
MLHLGSSSTESQEPRYRSTASRRSVAADDQTPPHLRVPNAQLPPEERVSESGSVQPENKAAHESVPRCPCPHTRRAAEGEGSQRPRNLLRPLFSKRPASRVGPPFKKSAELTVRPTRHQRRVVLVPLLQVLSTRRPLPGGLG